MTIISDILQLDTEIKVASDLKTKQAKINERADKLKTLKALIAEKLNNLTDYLDKFEVKNFQIPENERKYSKPFLNMYIRFSELIDICKLAAGLGDNSAYAAIANALLLFVGGLDSLRRHMIAGGIPSKEYLMAQYITMLRDITVKLKGAGFPLPTAKVL